MKLFEVVPPPGAHKRSTLRPRWYTWSSEAFEVIVRDSPLLRALPDPRLIAVRGCEPYDQTYSYAPRHIPRRLARHASRVGEALLSFAERHSFCLFTGMLREPLDSEVLHRLFAVLRISIAERLGDKRAALHAPINAARKDDGFPLHADLFLTRWLWLIFDDVWAGPAGQSLFLPANALLGLLRRNVLVPEAVRFELHRLFTQVTERDSFDRLMKLLHSTKNPWYATVHTAMSRCQIRVKLRKGEGYLLDDRLWLHGRTALGSSVSRSRFRRLAFGLA